MKANGIIAPVTEASSWVSALLVITKPDGRIRLCIDPKPLNEALKRERYRMPTIEDVLPQLAGAKVFLTPDVKKAFWTVRLDDESDYRHLKHHLDNNDGFLAIRRQPSSGTVPSPAQQPSSWTEGCCMHSR